MRHVNDKMISFREPTEQSQVWGLQFPYPIGLRVKAPNVIGVPKIISPRKGEELRFDLNQQRVVLLAAMQNYFWNAKI